MSSQSKFVAKCPTHGWYESVEVYRNGARSVCWRRMCPSGSREVDASSVLRRQDVEKQADAVISIQTTMSDTVVHDAENHHPRTRKRSRRIHVVGMNHR